MNKYLEKIAKLTDKEKTVATAGAISLGALGVGALLRKKIKTKFSLPYNSETHMGEEVFVDSFGKKMWKPYEFNKKMWKDYEFRR